MNLFKAILAGFLAVLALGLSVRPARAISIPDFPACTSPSGSVRVNYQSGVHGIPGDQGQYVGSDVVYTVSDSTLIQCFCAVSGSGIQTNWWKQDSLTQEQIDQLVKLGWIFVADGSAWGLDSAPYLAKNSNFNCGGNGGFTPPGPGPAPVCDSAKPGTPANVSVSRNGSTAALSWSSVIGATHYTIAYGLTPSVYIYGVPNTGNVTSYTVGSLDPARQYYFAVRAVNNCTPGDFATPGTGGQVLGLATTGNQILILSLVALGGLLLILAYLSRRSSHRA